MPVADLWDPLSAWKLVVECSVQLRIRKDFVPTAEASDSMYDFNVDGKSKDTDFKFSDAVERLNDARGLMASLPTNLQNPYVFRFPSQVLVSSYFLDSIVPYLVGPTRWPMLSRDLMRFFRRNFDLPLQVAFLSRRAGKSTSVAHLIIVMMVFCPGATIRILATTKEQACIILELVKEFVFVHYGTDDPRWESTKTRLLFHPGNKGQPSFVQAMACTVNVSPSHPLYSWFMVAVAPALG